MKTNLDILVVDDDKVARKIVEKHLKKAGFRTAGANDGQHALDLFDDQFFPIVLTDWMMPEIDGPKLCRLIREKRTKGYVYIVLITAKNSKTDIVSGLKSGADDYLTKPIHPAELIARVHSGIRVLKLEDSLMKAQESIRQLSITDPLTGCYNRSHLNERLPAELMNAQQLSHPLSIIMADIDYFKKVNDTYGHQAGDDILKQFAGCIFREIRKKIDWVVRYGGEEFLITLPQTTASGAFHMAERLRCAVESTTMPAGEHHIQITASFGGSCAFFNDEKKPVAMANMIAAADKKLYQSKEMGRNQVHIDGFAC